MDDLIIRRAAIEAMTADNLNWNMDSVYDDDLKRAARAAQRALARLPAAQRWIPTKERLPSPNEYDGQVARYYLVQNERGNMMVACYCRSAVYGKTWWEQIYHFGSLEDEIVAWMPLPEPYKEENDGL